MFDLIGYGVGVGLIVGLVVLPWFWIVTKLVRSYLTKILGDESPADKIVNKVMSHSSYHEGFTLFNRFFIHEVLYVVLSLFSALYLVFLILHSTIEGISFSGWAIESTHIIANVFAPFMSWVGILAGGYWLSLVIGRKVVVISKKLSEVNEKLKETEE